MDRPHLIYGPLSISFEIMENKNKEFEREYQQLSEIDSDAIGQWLRLEKAKGEFEDTDEVLVNLIVELHRKIDKLEKFIKGKEKILIELESQELIELVGFNHFELQKPLLEKNKIYYGRINMETYPERSIPIIFSSETEKLAKIEKLHNRDLKDWNSYIRARERIMIREKKGLNKW